jgi:uncharacterized protein (TIGR02001 family)
LGITWAQAANLKTLNGAKPGGSEKKEVNTMAIRKILAGMSVFGLAMTAALPAAANVEWSGTGAVTSDYVFRGISQSDRDPALQASLDLGYKGFFAGVWASSIDFGPIDPGADVEVDLYVGYKHDFNENTSLTGKVLYYWYPGADTSDADYFELMAALNHDFGKFSANLQVAYTPEYFGETDSAVWLGGGVSVPLNDWLSASGNIGFQWFDDNSLVGLNDYTHGDVGVTATWEVFSFDLRYVMTDIDNSDCSFDKWCDSKVVFTMTVATGSE